MEWDRNEIRYKSNVFDMILLFASEEGLKPIPNRGESILLEMIAAVIEYLGGNTGKIITPEQACYVDNWTGMVNNATEQALEQNSKRLNPAMIEALKSLLKIEWESERGETWRQSGIETMLMFRQRGMDRVFYLTVPEAQKTRENIEKTLDADTVNHCEQIGILMKKYIERDLIVFD